MTDQLVPGNTARITVQVASHQYQISGGGPRSSSWPDSEDGLTLGEDTWLAVLTTRQYGPVEVEFQAREDYPPVDETWEQISERDIEIQSRHEVKPGVPAGGRPYQLVVKEIDSGNLPIALVYPPGRYRVRISARDRTTPPDGFAEKHLVQAWPATGAAAPAVLRAAPVADPSAPITVDHTDVDVVAAVHRLIGLVNQPEPPSYSGEAVRLTLGRTIAASAAAVSTAIQGADTWLGWGGTPDLSPGGRAVLWIINSISSPEMYVRASATRNDLPHALSLTWVWSAGKHPVPPEPCTVDLTVTDNGGTTEVTVEVAGLPVELEAEGRTIWEYYLDRLDLIARKGPAGPHPWIVE